MLTLTVSEFPDSHDLNFSNRPVRTRMPGGVAGAQSVMAAPYADLKWFLNQKITLRPGRAEETRGGLIEAGAADWHGERSPLRNPAG